MAYLRARSPRPSQPWVTAESGTEQTEGTSEATIRGLRCSDGKGGETVMDEKIRSGASGYGNSSDYEWRWWHGVLGLAIMLAIISLTYS